MAIISMLISITHQSKRSAKQPTGVTIYNDDEIDLFNDIDCLLNLAGTRFYYIY